MKKTYLQNNIIQNIKQKRKQKGYTQEKMAELLNISYSNYSKIENGIVTPTLERLVDIAQILEVSLDYLVYGQINHDEIKTHLSNIQKEQAILSVLQNCDKENLLYLIQFLEKVYSLL